MREKASVPGSLTLGLSLGHLLMNWLASIVLQIDFSFPAFAGAPIQCESEDSVIAVYSTVLAACTAPTKWH